MTAFGIAVVVLTVGNDPSLEVEKPDHQLLLGVRTDPTKEQLEILKKAVEPLGGKVEQKHDAQRRRTFTWVQMPKATVDDDLKKLPAVPFSFGLDLCHTQVTDAGLKELASLKNLSSLSLLWTQVTDAGLKELAKLKSLSSLCLHGTQVTDGGLKELATLKHLSSLNLWNTKVTDVGIRELRTMLPSGCKIDR